MIEFERKESSLGLFIKRLNTKSPPRDRLGLAFDRGNIPTGRFGLPTPVLMRNPRIRGHDLYFNKPSQGIRLAKRAEVGQ